jgi:hypothetical protein
MRKAKELFHPIREQLLLTMEASKMNPHNWKVRDFTEEKDNEFAQEIMSKMNHTYYSRAERAIHDTLSSTARINESLQKSRRECLTFLQSKLSKTLNIVGAERYFALQNFVLVIRQYNLYFLNAYRDVDSETAKDYLNGLKPSGYDLYDSLEEIRRAIYEYAMMKTVAMKRKAIMQLQAEPNPTFFDIPWDEIEANSWDLDDETISSITMSNGHTMTVLIPHQERVAAVKTFMKHHPFKEFYNRLLEFEKDSNKEANISTIKEMVATYLTPAQLKWDELKCNKRSQGLMESSSSSSSAAAAGEESMMNVSPDPDHQVQTQLSRKERKKLSASAASTNYQYGTYTLPPRGNPRPGRGSGRFGRGNSTNSAPVAFQAYRQVPLPDGGFTFEPFVPEPSAYAAQSAGRGNPRGPPRPLGPECPRCKAMGITLPNALHHTAVHNDEIAKKVLARQNAQRQSTPQRSTNDP